MAKHVLTVQGMTCTGCERRIERALAGLEGIDGVKADFSRGRVELSCRAEPDRRAVSAALEKLGYTLGESRGRGALRAAGAGLLLVALWLILDRLGVTAVFDRFPRAGEGMGYAVLFVTGLATSAHCVAMCGGLNLSQTVGRGGTGTDGARAAIRAALLYNAGRVASYTLVGAGVGALGSVIALGPGGQGIITLLAGLFMVLMGLSLIGVVPGLGRLMPRMPRAFGTLAAKGAGRGPLIVGLLNGLMPCGPLQAMQLYALGTGSALGGALSMLVFALGTVPLMLALGAAGGLLTRGAARRVMAVGAALVVLMGMGSLRNGLGLMGVGGSPGGDAVAAEQGEEVQIIQTELNPRAYPAITVEAGVPVEWTITADEGAITGCNYALNIPEYDLSVTLDYGDNLIRFTPREAGTYTYSCWMGMIRSTITVT